MFGQVILRRISNDPVFYGLLLFVIVYLLFIVD